MKIFRLFTIAAAALILSACSSEDTAQNNNPVAGRQMHFTATIAAPNSGAGTRTEYTEDTENKKITVAWKVDDEIALVHDKVMDVVKVKTVNADGSATIDGTITSATDEATVQLVYPAARISGVTSDGNPVFDGSVEGKISSQDGTLTYIQNNIDFREGEGQLSVNGTEVTLNAAVDMVSTIAIWKLTLQNDAATPAALAATKVTIKSGSDELASTAVLTTGKSTLYLAVPADGTSANICITATTADNDYFYMKEGVALEAKKYYQSTVQMTKGAHLAFLSADYEAKDGAILTGTLASNVKISIANNATVTLKDANINGSGTWTNADHAGITCAGTATINLEGEGTNTVKGFKNTYPGIYVPENKTLTINGPGSLKASTGGTHGSGIGGIHWGSCGNIIITGGTITAEGGAAAAAIGSGNASSCGDITITGGNVTAIGNINNDYRGVGIGCGDGGGEATNRAKCGNITISGGTVTAIGKNGGVGIGSGWSGDCGTITITSGVTSVTATKGEGATNSIGAGDGGTCGTVTIEAGANVIATGHALSASAVGEIVGSDGKAYAVADKNYMPSGVTAVAMIAYVSGSNGLAIALADESGYMDWPTAKSTCEAKTPAFTGGTWKLPSLDEWKNMLTYDGGSYWNNNLQTALSTAGGNSLQEWIYYWSSTDYVSDNTQACDVEFMSGYANFSNESKTDSSGKGVRAVLEF